MKIKYLLFVLAVFSIVLGIALLIEDDSPLKIITSPKVYSMKHTELNETFKISVLMNRNDTYHLDTNYMRKSVLKDGENHLPLSVELVQVSDDTMDVKGESYYLVNFVVSLNIEMTDHLIAFNTASLQITYENNEIVDLYIGEFNYLFKENSDDLSMYNLQGTFGEVNGINTVTGVAVELHNQSNHNLKIKRIDIISEDVSLNNDYLIEKDREIDMFESVEDVLVIDKYSFETYESDEQQHLIMEDASKKFYVPLLYNSDIKYINRFVIMITYEIDGQEKVYYIDDFVFMNALHFGAEFEQYYQEYQYENN